MSNEILVLDDEENYALMLLDLLQHEGYRVDMATKPADALKKLKQRRFGLVVSDYKMPVMDGAEFLNEARVIDPNLPVIMVSGLMNTPELLKVANIGVTLVLEKPFDTEVFLAHVNKFVSPVGDEEPEAVEASFDSSTQGPAFGEGEEGEDEAVDLLDLFSFSDPDAEVGELRYLACESPQSRDFIHKLKSLQETRSHIFVAVAPNGEFELVMRELVNMQGDDGKRIYNLTATELDSQEVRDLLNQLPDDPTSAHTVSISGVEQCNDPQLGYLQTFIENATASIRHGEKLKFIYRLENPAFARKEAAEGSELWQRVVGEMLELVPLKFRVADVAGYSLNFLNKFAAKEKRPSKKVLSMDAIGALLSHSWEGDFNELVSVLKRAVLVGETERMEADDIKEIYSRNAGRDDETDYSNPLKLFLTNQQNAYLQVAADAIGGEKKSTLSTLKMDSRLAENLKDWSDLPFQFADTLKIDGKHRST